MMEYVGPNIAAFWRFFLGLIAIFFLTFRSIPSFKKIRPHLGGVALVGFVGLCGFIYFFTQGLNRTSAVNGALIVALNPVITLLLTSIFQGYKIRIKDIVGVVLALMGVVYLLTKGDLMALFQISFSAGDIYFLIAVFVFALQNIWIRKYSLGIGIKPFTFLTNFFCLIGLTALLVFEPMENFVPDSGRFWLAAFGMGVPGTAITYIAWNIGIQKAGPARGTIFLNAIPLIVALFAIPFGAKLYLFHLVSGLLILSGLLIVQVKFRKLNPAT